MPSIRLRVREFRLGKGLTQRQLAARAGVRQATISKLERDDRTLVDLRTLRLVATALGVEPGELIARGSAKRDRP